LYGRFKKQIKPALFGDVDLTELDEQKHASQIIEKVLSPGDIED
jgi:hypothetical protein